MIVRKVNRYYCEFCKKANCSKPSIAKHEQSCTLNPNRICGVCRLMDQQQPPMERLFEALPKRAISVPPDEDGMGFVHPMTEAETKALRNAAGNCPACMMAALRQKKIPVDCAYEFDFKKELDSIWNEFWSEKNNREVEHDYAAHECICY